MNIVFLNKVSQAARIPRTVILNLFKKTASVLPIKNKNKLRLSVVFVSSAESKKLNYKYRRKNRPTNILSFSSPDKNELGDLVICPQVVKKECVQRNQGFVERISYLFIHGLLHLLGYHHNNKKQEKLMEKLSNKILD